MLFSYPIQILHSKSELGLAGQIGIIVKGVEKHIQLILVFTASTHEITLNKKVSIPLSSVEKLSFRTGKLVMMESKQIQHPRIYID